MSQIVRPPWHLIDAAVARALEEDLGLAGDITSMALVDPEMTAAASLTFREDGVLAGTWTAEAACGHFDLFVAWEAFDGDVVPEGESAGRLEGTLSDLLTAERTILNFLCHLSGIATLTRRFVDAAGEAGVAIRDTRKTTPGLRALEKAAVRIGGGVNHRMGLFDAILVKDNHIAAMGGDVAAIVALGRERFPGVTIEVECDTLEQVDAAAATGCDLILLDNMSPATVSEAVVVADGRCGLEVSGGVTLDTVADYAATGVDFVSVGAVTHSAPIVDIGLDFLSVSGDLDGEIRDFLSGE